MAKELLNYCSCTKVKNVFEMCTIISHTVIYFSELLYKLKFELMSWHQTKHILYHNSLILLFPTADCVLMIIADVKARGGEHKLYSFDILYERTPEFTDK